jgi:hypothetical protein
MTNFNAASTGERVLFLLGFISVLVTRDEVEGASAVYRTRLALESAGFVRVELGWVGASLDMFGYNLFESRR